MFINLPKKLKDELKTITVIITGGGTGGHVYPAIAIADRISKDPNFERVVYIGCSNSLEEKVACEHELNFLPIKFSGMPRKLSFTFIKWLLELNKAFVDSLSYLLYLKPDIVIGTGGYVSAPVLLASLLLNIPYIIHEADAYPGLVNRILSPWAAGISIAFKDASLHLKNSEINLFGNPLRNTIGEYTRNEACIFLELDPNKKILLVIGGSQGAKKINDALIEALPTLLFDHGLQIIHQCGIRNLEEVTSKIPNEILNNPSYILKGYFDNLEIPLSCADIAVSRAGSMAISEITACLIPSILIPYPYSAANHQQNNAKSMEKEGVSIYLDNDDCTKDNLINTVCSLLYNPDKLDYMRLACNQVAKRNATMDIIKLIKTIAKPTKVAISKDITEEN